MADSNDPELIRDLLTTPAPWAVAGLSTDTSRTAYAIADFLRTDLSMTIIPVHPRAGTVFDQTGYATLGEIPDGQTVSVVDCFVNSSRVGGVVDQAIEQRDRLGIKAVWLQLGVIDEAAASRASAAGLGVVMDTCPKVEWPRVTPAR